jgi:hypothetical protein
MSRELREKNYPTGTRLLFRMRNQLGDAAHEARVEEYSPSEVFVKLQRPGSGVVSWERAEDIRVVEVLQAPLADQRNEPSDIVYE